MARLAALSSSRGNSVTYSTTDSLYRTPSIPPPPLANNLSNSPNGASPNSGSDKENNQARRAEIRMGKMPAVNIRDTQGAKRRRLSDRDGMIQYESSSSDGEPEADNGLDEDEQEAESTALTNSRSGPEYDPNQSISERREVRKNYRELDKKMQDQRTEWMEPSSHALEDALREQNLLFNRVKQSVDATIDSRMLVHAGDMTYKRTKNLNAGENAQGIDLDEFVGKCMTFMREAHGSTQRRHDLPPGADAADDDEEENQGNALDWSALGTQACFPSNVRPPTIGFLLGPLSVQKRVKPPTQRRERLQKTTTTGGPVEAVRAKELQPADLAQQQAAGVTAICQSIRAIFLELRAKGLDDLRQFWLRKDANQLTPAQEREFERYNYIMDDGGVHLFKFVMHPSDFGQSAENLFYVSFLIKEDWLKICLDADTGIPSLHPIPKALHDDQQRVRGTRHQAVFGLDFDTWEEIVRVYGVDECMIPDRAGEYAELEGSRARA